ncbi:MAG: SAM-dependent methyltransferase [Fibrobacteres bacterium]|nr:SAM-dependent methyltransferase [Fibrobacterota bacterium]
MEANRLESKEAREIDYWRTMPSESPESEDVGTLLNKITDAPNLLECLARFGNVFPEGAEVLELGAGQGWASCLLKRMHPKARFTVSDISEYAVASIHKWEHIFQVKAEKTFACKSYEIPSGDAAFDVIFAFASAHHFGAHRKTLAEIKRVLKPGGQCLYLHEPCCRRWIYKAAHRRVNRTRDTVPEDVIVFPKLVAIAKEAGLEVEFIFTPTLNKRLPFEFLYYFAMRKIPFLQQLLPCTGCFRFVRPA